MASFTAWLVKKGSEIKVFREAVIVLFLLAMMAEMFISFVIYLYFPTFATIFGLLIINMVAMFAILMVIWTIPEPKTLDETVAGIVPVRTLIIALIITLVTLSEVFMGWTFALIGAFSSTVGGLQGIFSTITKSLSSFWFIFMTSAEMAITLFFIRDRLPKAFSWIVVSQIIIMILSPTAIANSLWAEMSLAVGNAIMTFLFIYIFRFLHKNQTLSKGILNYLLFLMIVYALMMVGQFIWLLSGDALVFALSIILEMVVYFVIVLNERKLISYEPRSWQSMPYWIICFLFLVFVVEFFMSGIVDIQLCGSGFFNGVISASTAWSLSRILTAGFYIGSMAVLIAWLVKKGSEIKTSTEAGIVLFLLSIMATTFISTVVYIYIQASVTLLELVAVNLAIGGITAFVILFGICRGNEGVVKKKDGAIKPVLIGLIIVLVIFSEVFMGWTFAVLGGTISISSGLQGVYSALIHSSSSLWFIFMMSAEMAITLFLIRDRLPKPIIGIMASQTVIMILSPTAIANSLWANLSLAAGSAVMIFLFIYVFEFLYKNRITSKGILNYLILLMLAYALMMAGQFLWLLNGDASVFVFSILFEMVVYFAIVLDEKKLVSSKLVSWQSMPYWVFGFLVFLFVAEFFMGGIIDIQAYGKGFLIDMMFVSTAGSFVNSLSASLFNFMMFFTTITMSPWYLIMMGIEMGALVVLKIKYTRDLETKIRLVLMILAYGIYTVFLPVFIIPAQTLAQIPWLGWNMGIGTLGAIAPVAVVALLGTYLISGILSFLFGSRQLCSVMCMAPLMYQGTAIDAMNSFNSSSCLARRLLTNKISSFFKVAASAVWVSLLVAAVMSYLTSAGILDISIYGMDVAYFLYMFYFGFLWYILWMLIPFVGTYGCISTGMCGWGTFNQLISRVGLFKLTVKDKTICIDCKTKDCGKVCPLGLTNMPMEFSVKGEFKNYKCIGEGNCILACPYQIISIYDLRHWLRERFRRKDKSTS